MLSHEWITLITLGHDRWDTQSGRARTSYEIEREEAWRELEAHLVASRRARRRAVIVQIRTLLARLVTLRPRKQPPHARPRTRAWRV